MRGYGVCCLAFISAGNLPTTPRRLVAAGRCHENIHNKIGNSIHTALVILQASDAAKGSADI